MGLPFSGTTNAQGDEKRRAELYTKIYKYAAEDFVSTKDFLIFEAKLNTWMVSVEQRLKELFTIVSNHTHPLIPHIHPILPHFHISATPGNPTSPNVYPFGINTELSLPYTIQKPIQSTTIKWAIGFIPRYINTTGRIPNITGNNVVLGTKIDIAEDSTPHLRRGTVIPILAMPNVPEYVESLK